MQALCVANNLCIVTVPPLPHGVQHQPIVFTVNWRRHHLVFQNASLCLCAFRNRLINVCHSHHSFLWSFYLSLSLSLKSQNSPVNIFLGVWWNCGPSNKTSINGQDLPPPLNSTLLMNRWNPKSISMYILSLRLRS